jgi:UDP-2,3-diacylglucosamine hydrolase
LRKRARLTGSHFFIADLHLDPIRRGTTRLALRFLQLAHGKQHVYILGDLFEYWLGDDVGLSLYEPVVDSLKQLARSGCGITVMLGNRDFLLDEAFASTAGVQLISSDEHVIDLDGTRVLLMHGDTLCTDDVDYQRFRKNVRESRWRKQFLAKTADERREHAEALRAASHDASVSKPVEIMDVNTATAATRLNETDCHVLIHGHTHRPAIHEDADTARRRLVLGDWHVDYARYVQWDANRGFRLQTFS